MSLTLLQYVINQSQNIPRPNYSIPENVPQCSPIDTQLYPYQDNATILSSDKDPSQIIKLGQDEDNFIREVYFLAKIMESARNWQNHLIQLICYDPVNLHMRFPRYDADLISLIGSTLLQTHGVSIQRQCMAAILKVHELGIIHRDIKLDNFLYQYDVDKHRYHVVLADFGSAIDDKKSMTPKKRAHRITGISRSRNGVWRDNVYE